MNFCKSVALPTNGELKIEKMKRKITRLGKVLIAEVYKEFGQTFVYEVRVDSKKFNTWGAFFGDEPTEEHYKQANEWLDGVINLHNKHTRP